MNTIEELDALPSQVLHDRALRHARRHLNAAFFWKLLRMIPVAEAAVGDVDEADDDIAHPSSLLVDAINSDDELVDALRPLFIDYLLKHPDA